MLRIRVGQFRSAVGGGAPPPLAACHLVGTPSLWADTDTPVPYAVGYSEWTSHPQVAGVLPINTVTQVTVECSRSTPPTSLLAQW
jgi:hypothetical protein